MYWKSDEIEYNNDIKSCEHLLNKQNAIKRFGNFFRLKITESLDYESGFYTRIIGKNALLTSSKIFNFCYINYVYYLIEMSEQSSPKSLIYDLKSRVY